MSVLEYIRHGIALLFSTNPFRKFLRISKRLQDLDGIIGENSSGTTTYRIQNDEPYYSAAFDGVSGVHITRNGVNGSVVSINSKSNTSGSPITRAYFAGSAINFSTTSHLFLRQSDATDGGIYFLPNESVNNPPVTSTVGAVRMACTNNAILFQVYTSSGTWVTRHTINLSGS